MHKFIPAASVAVLTLVGPVTAQSPFIIKFSHVVAPDTPKGKGSQKFQKPAQHYTGGTV